MNAEGFTHSVNFSKLSIHFLHLLFPILDRRGLLEPLRAVKGREAGSSMHRSPAYRSFTKLK